MPIRKEDKNTRPTGHIPLSRKLFGDDIFWTERREFSRFEAWIDLIQFARYKEGTTEKMIDNKLCTWDRGQLIASYRFLAKRWGWHSLSKVKRFLGVLQECHRIETATEHGMTKITLCNYEVYNTLRDTDETKKRQQRDSKETETKQNSNKDNKGKKVLIYDNNNDLSKLFAIWGKPNPNQGELVSVENLTKEFSYDDIKNAFHKAADQGTAKCNVAYVRGILKNNGHINGKSYAPGTEMQRILNHEN